MSNGPENIYTPSYRDQFSKLLTSANVKWFGFRPIHEIPAYVKGMDVCAIPNKVNEYTQYVYPIKLQEYLAAGKPIISSDMARLRSFEQLMRSVASTPLYQNVSVRTFLPPVFQHSAAFCQNEHMMAGATVE